MKSLLMIYYDKLLVALATTLLAASGGWMWSHRADIGRLRQQPVAVHLTGAAYDRFGLSPPGTQPAVWSEPAPQAPGGEWLYEVFTPPSQPVDEDRPIGLELLDVRREPYRLQLVGYFGEPGDYLAAFVSPEQPGTLLARRGYRFEQLGITLQSFAVRKIAVEHGDAWPVYDMAALAVLFDEKTGTEVVLDSRVRKLTDTPLAVLRLPTAGPPRVLREGDTVADGRAVYCIERIQLEPPEVILARVTPGLPRPEAKILHPVDRNLAAKAAAASKLPAPDRAGVAANGN